MVLVGKGFINPRRNGHAQTCSLFSLHISRLRRCVFILNLVSFLFFPFPFSAFTYLFLYILFIVLAVTKFCVTLSVKFENEQPKKKGSQMLECEILHNF